MTRRSAICEKSLQDRYGTLRMITFDLIA